MRSAFGKEVARSITHSLGRFVAIAAIVALGTGFYAGLRMTCPDMKLAADAYTDATSLMDVRVVSTLGLSEDDVSALEAVDGVEAVMPARETDVMALISGEQYPLRIHSLDASASSSTQPSDIEISSEDDGYLNRVALASGRWPENPNECVVSADRVMNTPTVLGDTVSVCEGTIDLDDVLSTREYTIVGTVHSSYYISSVNMGATSLGSGTIQQYMYVPDGAFSSDYPYTEAFLTVAGARNEIAGSDAYNSIVADALANVEAIAPAREQARYDDLRSDAQSKLDDARAEYEQQRSDAEAQLNDALAQLNSAATTIAQSESDLAQGQAAYDAGVAELASQRAVAQERFSSAEAQIAEGEKNLAALKQAFGESDPRVVQAQAQIDASRAQLEAGRSEAQAQFVSAQSTLDASAAQLQSGRASLEQGRSEYYSGLAEYEENRAKANEEFADVEAELAEAQKKIDDIEMPSWLVMDRAKNYGSESFTSDAERVDHIAQVFPFIFFLVAALVSLTTMTRMVEEERVLIGTFKALGYSRARITMKYIIYAAIASVVGSALGIAVLSLVLPTVIMEAYAIIYYVPHGMVSIDLPLALLSAGLGVGVTLVATWAAALNTLREQPAHLMLPRAPKAGKRILLERVRPLWRRLSFSWKITCRNLFLYKKRFVMTLIGIAGCTALLLTGLGLQNSINDIIDKQFGELIGYNVVVRGSDDMAQESRDRVDALLTDVGEATLSSHAQMTSMIAVGSQGTDSSVTVIVPENDDEFAGFWNMRERLSGNPVSIGDDGVVVTEKLATMLGVGVGGQVVLAEPDDMGNATSDTKTLTITAVMENYIGNYVMVGRSAYAEVFAEEPHFTTSYALMTTNADARADFTDQVREVEGVKTVAYNDETIDTYRTMLRSVNMIVVVLVVAAAMLAFIVLYNLTNINITERVREIATLKVLGFTPREVDQYIFRETILLSILGCVVGLALGVFLEGFVIVTAEVDQVMFGRDIHASSFVIAFFLTMVFTVFVTFVMRRKLAAVDMIESLKSNE